MERDYRPYSRCVCMHGVRCTRLADTRCCTGCAGTPRCNHLQSKCISSVIYQGNTSPCNHTHTHVLRHLNVGNTAVHLA